MYLCMYVCVYVCVCMYTHTHTHNTHTHLCVEVIQEDVMNHDEASETVYHLVVEACVCGG